jgi:hypothetical protein
MTAPGGTSSLGDAREHDRLPFAIRVSSELEEHPVDPLDDSAHVDFGGMTARKRHMDTSGFEVPRQPGEPESERHLCAPAQHGGGWERLQNEQPG